MRIVVISDRRADAMPAIRLLLERWPDTAVLRPVDPPRPSAPDRFRVELRHPMMAGRRLYHRARSRRQNEALKKLLPSGGPPVPCEEFPRAALNGGSVRQRLGELAPDVLVLIGCPILRDEVLSIPKLGTINVHLGIAPRYRGEHTIFHALRQRDYAHIGATIHQVDRGIDSGPLIAHLFPELRPTDDETTLLAATARIVGPVLVDYLELVEARHELPGRHQEDVGRLYRRKDRYVRHDAVDWLNRVVLGRRPPPRPARVVRHDEQAFDSISAAERAKGR